MQWQDRSTPYSVATHKREHNGRTFVVDAYRDADTIALHAHSVGSASWGPVDQRIARIEVRAAITAQTCDADVRTVCDLMAGMCATLAREAER